MKNKLLEILSSVLSDLNFPLDNIIIQIPKNPDHGDFTTNYPMINSKNIGMSPIEIARNIVEGIQKKTDR